MSSIVRGIECPKCNDIVYSRHRHDLRWCSCNSCYIDGGFDYMRVGFIKAINPNDIISHTISIPYTKEELHNDYKSGKNDYGILTIKKEMIE